MVFTSRGRYITCDAETPHFSIKAKELKLYQIRKLLLVHSIRISGVPTPLAIPFGFFPNQKKQSSGIIFPFYENLPIKAFKKCGTTLPLTIMDLSLIGDITKGSWNLKVNSNYKRKYRYQGNVNCYSSLKVAIP